MEIKLKNIAFIILITLGVQGCEDKKSTELNSDSELSLNIQISHNEESSWDNFTIPDEVSKSQSKKLSILINLYEVVFNEHSALNNNAHIEVLSRNVFNLVIDGTSYDLTKYYNEPSYHNSEGYYRFYVDEFEKDIRNISVNYTVEGKTYNAEVNVTPIISVVNQTGLTDDYNFLSDDIMLEWGHASLFTNLHAHQSVFFKVQESNVDSCKKNNYNVELLDGVYSHIISNENLWSECESVALDEISIVNTFVNISHEATEVPSNFYGFNNVSVLFEQSYSWHYLYYF